MKLRCKNQGNSNRNKYHGIIMIMMGLFISSVAVLISLFPNAYTFKPGDTIEFFPTASTERYVLSVQLIGEQNKNKSDPAKSSDEINGNNSQTNSTDNKETITKSDPKTGDFCELDTSHMSKVGGSIMILDLVGRGTYRTHWQGVSTSDTKDCGASKDLNLNNSQLGMLLAGSSASLAFKSSE